ncbi:MAG: DUF92 domain-containing protein [Fibrobacteres bacterium]|nr:DUF92 domain-containing protein [Fibrobacterota bacterium]
MARSPTLTRAELQRKAAHAAAFWPALLLPWLSPLQAMGVTAALLLMNLFVLPRAAPVLYRAEADGMGALEIILYPAALCACVAAVGYPAGGKPAWYLPLGAAWFALACIDAAIGLCCRAFPGGPSLPWNRRKPVTGVLLGCALAALPGLALAHWAARPQGAREWMGLGILFVAAAVAETLWFGVADNVVIPFTVCVLAPLVPGPLWPPGAGGILAGAGAGGIWPEAGSGIGTALLVGIPAAFGLLAWAARLLTPGGAVAGALMAFLLVRAEPWLFAFLAGFFVLGNLATRIGFAGKRERGIAEARGGRRGAAEVFGAMGLAAWMTPLAHLARARGGDVTPALLVIVAPLAAKAFDTVSSEIGKAVGGTTISLRSFRTVPAGSEGGVSLAGTLAGLAAAALMCAGIVPLGWGGWGAAGILLAISLAANVFESYWGEYAAGRGLDQGPHANVLMTLLAAVLAWLAFAAGLR